MKLQSYRSLVFYGSRENLLQLDNIKVSKSTVVPFYGFNIFFNSCRWLGVSWPCLIWFPIILTGNEIFFRVARWVQPLSLKCRHHQSRNLISLIWIGTWDSRLRSNLLGRNKDLKRDLDLDSNSTENSKKKHIAWLDLEILSRSWDLTLKWLETCSSLSETAFGGGGRTCLSLFNQYTKLSHVRWRIVDKEALCLPLCRCDQSNCDLWAAVCPDRQEDPEHLVWSLWVILVSVRLRNKLSSRRCNYTQNCSNCSFLPWNVRSSPQSCWWNDSPATGT